jgi:hypothetical protein
MLSDPRWTYDDPSGVPDEVPVTLHLPERMLAPVQEAAARDGVTPGAWLLVVVARALSPVRPTHA